MFGPNMFKNSSSVKFGERNNLNRNSSFDKSTILKIFKEIDKVLLIFLEIMLFRLLQALH